MAIATGEKRGGSLTIQGKYSGTSGSISGRHWVRIKRMSASSFPSGSRGSQGSRGSRSTFALAIFAGLAATLAAAAACTTDYQKGLDDPNYGTPNALAGQKQPGTSTDLQQGNPGGEGGTSGSSSGGGTAACVKAGGQLLGDAGACTVSFKTDVLGALGGAQPTCSSTTCHGGVSPPNPPRIDPGDPAGMYTEFVGFKLSNGAPYINPCSTDPTKAGMECNLATANPCGSHMPQGGQLAADAITKIDTWLKCGSPNN
jgi:hypothetical protein